MPATSSEKAYNDDEAEQGVQLGSGVHDQIIALDTFDSSRPNSTTSLQYPEGGTEAWLVVLGSFCALFLVFSVVNSTAVFQAYLSTHQLQNESTTSIAWIFSVNLFLAFFCGLYSGNVFDRHGPRLLVVFGSLALITSMMLLGLCYEYWHFMLTYGVLGGVGGALLMTPAFACIAHFFDRRRALATGLANTSGSVGGIIIPLMLQSLIDKIGFAWSTRVLGFLFIGLAIPANLFLKTRLPVIPSSQSLWPDMSILRRPSFAALSVGMFLMEWGLFVVQTYIASFAINSGETGISSYGIVALLSAGSFFGRWLPGLLADRYGRFNVIITTISLCCVTILAFWLPAGSSTALLVVFALSFGFASGSNLGLIPVCISQLCSPEVYGRYLSTAYFVTSFGTLTSIPIGGAILETSRNDYKGLIIFAAMSYGCALLCYIASKGIADGVSMKRKF
ncbi:hypothetical protein AMS68_005787 [Peltaster fructicola]|uniref:Major facilitator superfamily (MFS) profile domain-containing protein n=1 Tax=Peltaster fructicola TaxID=286661 RepID=A0A6H0Y0U0_9PEZI|nr:hypothetical protein AMS68_005787 [Peltaster fructicola]